MGLEAEHRRAESGCKIVETRAGGKSAESRGRAADGRSDLGCECASAVLGVNVKKQNVSIRANVGCQEEIAESRNSAADGRSDSLDANVDLQRWPRSGTQLG